MNMPDEVILQNAQFKRDTGRGLKNSEITALRMADRIQRRPVSDNYRPLGAITAQIVDRIHTIYDPYGGGGLSSARTYTFSGCVDGEPMDFEVYIASGPTPP